MAISNISFGNFYDQDKDINKTSSAKKGNHETRANLDVPDFMKNRASKASRIRTNSDGDRLEIYQPKREAKTEQPQQGRKTSNNEKAKAERQKARKEQQARAKRVKTGIIAAATAATIAIGGPAVHKEFTRFDPASANVQTYGHSIEEMAEFSGVDEKAIMIANQEFDADAVLDEIVVPESYSPLGDEIAALEEKIESGQYKDEKLTEAKEQLAGFKAKQAEQSEIGETYIDEDGKFVYIIPDEPTSNETIKDAFGIKDGVIKDYNKTSFDWAFDKWTESYYKDYTNSGTTGLRVPANEIGNFDD